ncbi:response regulator [Tropicimonas aquimaris]|uniref:Response regulator n=1 Tax=Tropicimonas aquimaris TaxID=914152 RepID=A0ABW3ITW5_9RHOB
MRVLVVQDDPNVQSLWSGILEESGHEVVLVETESAALKTLQTSAYDLVLLDLCLNGRDALAVTTFATYRNPSCKVVVVSGSAVFSQKRLFAMSPAVAAALRKPVDIEDLIAVCDRVHRNERGPARPVMESSGIEFRP